MAEYSTVALSGYNSSPPSDDGATTSTNSVRWATHIDKIGDPLRDQVEAIDAALLSRFSETPHHPRTAAETTAGVTPTNYKFEPGDLRRYGAVIDGVTDDTTALQNCMDGAGFVLPWVGTILIDNVTTTTVTNIKGDWNNSIILLDTPAVSETVAITLANAGSSIEGVHFDCDNTNRTAVRVTAVNCRAYFTAQDLNADIGLSGQPSALEVTTGGDDFQGGVYAENFANTGHANDSMPRVITVQGTATNYRIDYCDGKVVRAGLTIGSTTGPGHVRQVVLEDSSDNGLYVLGGLCTVDRLHYRANTGNIDEALVHTGGTLHVGDVFVESGANSINSIVNLDDSDENAMLVIDNITIDAEAATGGSLIRTRSGNTEFGKAVINSVAGKLRGSTLLALNVGTVEHITIRDVDLEFVYDATVAPTITSWGNFSGCKGFHFENWNIKIIDEDDALTSSNFFEMTAPTANLDRKSVWRDIFIELTDADEMTESVGNFRALSMASSLIYVYNAQWQQNIGPYIRNVNYGDGVPDSANQAPTAGTWRAGQRLYDSTPSASGTMGWVCTASGTFSSATDGTGDTDGSTAVITGMTDTSDFRLGQFVTVSAGFPSASDPYKIIALTSTTMTLDTASTSSQTNVTVATPDPVFNTFGSISA